MSDMLDRPIPEDTSVEGHRARIQQAVEQYINGLAEYIDELVKRYAPHVRWWTGTAERLNTGSKTVLVQMDAFPEAPAADPVIMGWGRKTWVASQIEGKRVRFFIDIDSKQHWIDDVLE